MEQQVEGNGAAQHFRQVAGAYGHLAHQPIGPSGPPRIPVAAALGEVLPSHHAQSGGNDLHENGHEAGQPDYPQEAVLELSAALQVRSPVAGVHVTNVDQVLWPYKRPPLLPESGLVVRHLDGTVHPLQRHVGVVPDSLGCCVTTRTVPCSGFRIQSGTLKRKPTAQWFAVEISTSLAIVYRIY